MIKNDDKNIKKSELKIRSEIIEEITNFEEYLQNEKENFIKNYNNKIVYPGSENDFQPVVTLGVGSFGTVFLVRQKQTGDYFAMKLLIKSYIVRARQIEHTLNEKRILQNVRFRFTVCLNYFYINNNYLYFILPFVQGGDMFNLLRMFRTFPEHQAKFYAAQVLLGLEYLHYLDLVYRDLKPENLMIDSNGNTKITDFGFCKIIKERTYTLCGTPDYIAPEIILSKGYGKSVDYWSFGVLIYEMVSGFAPFVAPDPIRLYEKIATADYYCPDFFTKELKHLIQNILQIDLSRRYGVLKNGINDIKYHSWFREIDWNAMLNFKMTPPHKPDIEGPEDIQNFDLPYIPITEFKVSKNDHYMKYFKEF